MGVEIIVLTNLQKVTEDDRHIFSFHNAPGTDKRCTAFEGCYDGACPFEFDLSYNTYYLYLGELAKVSGYRLEEAGRNPEDFKRKAFTEQINFSGLEGCIDFNTARLLYEDYELFNILASMSLDQWDYEIYCSFKEAFRLAAETNGVVMYF